MGGPEQCLYKAWDEGRKMYIQVGITQSTLVEMFSGQIVWTVIVISITKTNSFLHKIIETGCLYLYIAQKLMVYIT